MASLKASLPGPGPEVPPTRPSSHLGHSPHALPSASRGLRTRRGRLCTFIGFMVLLAILLNPIAAIGLSLRQWLVSTDNVPYTDTPLVLFLSDRYDISTCIHGNDWTAFDAKTVGSDVYTAVTSFDIPVASPLLSLIANGHFPQSNLRVVSATHPSPFITVGVVAKYRSRSAFGRVAVCPFHGIEGEEGVGLIGPFGRRAMVNFDVTVYLPPTEDGSIRTIPELKTHLPMFRQSFDDLLQDFQFGSISLGGVNSPVDVKSIQAESVSIRTEYAPIYGTFDTTSSLELCTKNAPILVTINAYNDVANGTSNLTLVTENGSITAKMSLFSADPSGTTGNFNVSATTRNGLIKIDNPVSPPDVVLNLLAKTINAPAEVALWPAFQGSFLTRGTANQVTHVEHPEDPTGRSRQRKFSVEKVVGDLVQGRVWWASDSGEDP
ncbi:hypothetical protein OF83DRAFT_1130717, partial [Amylostereum chailletii]